MVATISPKRLSDLRQSGAKVELIDVRTPLEFQEVHVDFARNIPLDRLAPEAVSVSRTGPQAEPLYVICRSRLRITHNPPTIITTPDAKKARSQRKWSSASVT